MTSSSDITKSGGILSELENILGGPGPCSGNSGSEHNDDISEKYLLSVLALSIEWKMMLSPDLSGGNGLCLLFILASDLTILHNLPGGIDLFICDFFIEIIPSYSYFLNN